MENFIFKLRKDVNVDLLTCDAASLIKRYREEIMRARCNLLDITMYNNMFLYRYFCGSCMIHEAKKSQKYILVHEIKVAILLGSSDTGVMVEHFTNYTSLIDQ